MIKKIYPRTGDTQTVYLNAVVKDPSIEVGDYWKSHATLTPLAKQDCPLWLQYD